MNQTRVNQEALTLVPFTTFLSELGHMKPKRMWDLNSGTPDLDWAGDTLQYLFRK